MFENFMSEGIIEDLEQDHVRHHVAFCLQSMSCFSFCLVRYVEHGHFHCRHCVDIGFD